MPDLTRRIKTTPFAHQQEVLEASWDRPYFGLLLEMGTGKSKILLDTIALLYDDFKIDGALIIAPKGVYGTWADTQIPTHLHDEIPRQVLLWTPDATKKALRAQTELIQFSGLAVLVMNTEALSTKKGVEFAQRFLSRRRALMAVDESTAIKNPSAARTKAAIKLGQSARYRRILSGSPVTRSPMDLYSQAQFLRLGLLGHSSFFSYRNRYAIMRQRHMGARSFREVVGYHRLDELQSMIGEWSSRILKADCLDLPPKIYQIRHVEMTDEQRSAYEQMRLNAVAMLEGGEVSAAMVAITQILRCHQIACGHLPTDAGVVSLPTNRIKALLETLDEVSGRAIIWASYRHDIAAIRDALTEEYGPASVVTYFGDTSDEDRARAVREFQSPESPVRWFVGQPRTGGFGLTLTAANVVVYFSNSYDLEVRLQSEDRAHRIGQTQSVTYVDLMTRGTVDEMIVRSLRDKIDLATQVLGDGWKEWLAIPTDT